MQFYYIDIKDLKLKEDKPISYTIYYTALVDNSQKQRGPFSFTHFSSEKYTKPFEILWVADFDLNEMVDVKTNKKINYGKISYDQMINYYNKNKNKIPFVIGGGDYAYDF